MRLIDVDTIQYRSVFEPDENGKYRMVEFVYKEEIDRLPTICPLSDNEVIEYCVEGPCSRCQEFDCYGCEEKKE